MLRDVQFKHSYSSGYDEPKDFFTEALIESSTFDLGLGFFSSSGIRSLAYGFALFIANGGNRNNEKNKNHINLYSNETFQENRIEIPVLITDYECVEHHSRGSDDG